MKIGVAGGGKKFLLWSVPSLPVRPENGPSPNIWPASAESLQRKAHTLSRRLLDSRVRKIYFSHKN